jgi:hypothetical protein
MQNILNRFREPSTWAGLSALALIFGVPNEAVEQLAQVVAGVSGLAAVLLPEQAAKVQ